MKGLMWSLTLLMLCSCVHEYEGSGGGGNTGGNSCDFAFDGRCDEPVFCDPGTDSADCSVSDEVNNATGFCVGSLANACEGDADCAGDLRCLLQVCLQPCGSDSECSSAACNELDSATPNNTPNNTPDPDPFLFVMVTDTTPNPSGDTPGADVDAIGLIKADGTEVFAATIESDDLDCDNNTACDTNGILGAPDVVDNGECFVDGFIDTQLFTSLNGYRVVVSFTGGAEVENGDSIHVYEIGATECGRFDNDPFSVSVGVSDDLDGTFIVIGEGGNGNNIIPVSGL